MAGLLTGTFIIEKIFAIPGLGKYFVDSIFNRDYPVIMGTTIFYSALLIFVFSLQTLFIVLLIRVFVLLRKEGGYLNGCL